MSELLPVSVIVPWRSNGDPNRERNLESVVDWLSPLGLPIILADDGRAPGMPFNRSTAFNHGMQLSPSEVYVWHEADMLVPHDQLLYAIEDARGGLGLVVPFTEYRYLSRESSEQAWSNLTPSQYEPAWTMPNGSSIGAVSVCSAETMRWVGRWDEGFEGHGFDDRAMFHAFDVAAGTRYVDGPAWHLWHPEAFSPWKRGDPAGRSSNFDPAEVEATYRNKARYRRYRDATTPEQIRDLTGAPWGQES